MNPEQGHSASAPGVVLDDNDPGRGNAVDRRQVSRQPAKNQGCPSHCCSHGPLAGFAHAFGGMDACMETSSGKHCCQPESLLPVTPSPAVCAGGLTHQLYWSLPTEWSWYGFTEMVCTPP